MTFLLDTNVLSELRKGPRGNTAVWNWSNQTNFNNSCISVLAIGEIRRGIEGKRRRDPHQAAILERWLRSVQDMYAGRILDVTREIAETWGAYRVGAATSQIDGLMLATAECHGLVFATRNVKDVSFFKAKLFNPFDV